MITQIVPYRDCLFLLDSGGAIFVVECADIDLEAKPDPALPYRLVQLVYKPSCPPMIPLPGEA